MTAFFQNDIFNDNILQVSGFLANNARPDYLECCPKSNIFY